MTIHNAVAKKTENHLQKKIRFKDSIITQREFIEVDTCQSVMRSALLPCPAQGRLIAGRTNRAGKTPLSAQKRVQKWNTS